MELPELNRATRVVNKMLEKDTYGRWLNGSIEKVEAGYCLMKIKVRSEFLNGVGTLHGGVIFGIADVAFAYAIENAGEAAQRPRQAGNENRKLQVGAVYLLGNLE